MQENPTDQDISDIFSFVFQPVAATDLRGEPTGLELDTLLSIAARIAGTSLLTCVVTTLLNLCRVLALSGFTRGAFICFACLELLPGQQSEHGATSLGWVESWAAAWKFQIACNIHMCACIMHVWRMRIACMVHILHVQQLDLSRRRRRS